jgi:hypothetical protein
MQTTPDAPMSYREALEQGLKKYRWLKTRMTAEETANEVQEWIVDLEAELAKCAER